MAASFKTLTGDIERCSQPIVAGTRKIYVVFHSRYPSISQIGSVKHRKTVEDKDEGQKMPVKFANDSIFFSLGVRWSQVGVVAMVDVVVTFFHILLGQDRGFVVSRDIIV